MPNREYVFTAEIYRNPAWGLRSPDNRDHYEGVLVAEKVSELKKKLRENYGPEIESQTARKLVKGVMGAPNSYSVKMYFERHVSVVITRRRMIK